jgi:hypothetical protein
VEQEQVAVHLPRSLIEQVDVVARDELRSRAGTVRWLISEQLRQREPADAPKGGSE